MNQVILAPAGGRKTQRIIDLCSHDTSDTRKQLIITYTTNAQQILEDRLLTSNARHRMPIVQGWYSFLLNHIVRPYIPSVFPNRRVRGLCQVGKSPSHSLAGEDYYLARDGDVRCERLALLANKVLKQDGAAVIDRLEHLFSKMYIDEIQDLRSNDLDILEFLLKSSIKVVLVGDVRQRLLSTSRSSNRYKQYDGLGLLGWFSVCEKKGMLEVERIHETWRCCQAVIDFADAMFPEHLFPATTSYAVPPEGEHSGVWALTDDTIEEYIRRFQPACYRHSVSTELVGTDQAISFGQCKGATENHVLIFPTRTLLDFWSGTKRELPDKSRMEAYVGITRAKWSVGIYVGRSSSKSFPFPAWQLDSHS